MSPGHAVFLIHLVQDVNVLRPLIFMASRDFGFAVTILVSPRFRARDLPGIWEAELDLLRQETGARVVIYQSELEALSEMTGSGLLISASESSLIEHDAAHQLFRYAPAGYLKVTLQHGFECVGFRHSLAHDRTYGSQVSFAADVVCAWQPPKLLRSLQPSQRAKVEVTGPSSVLQAHMAPVTRSASSPGLVCENLHSVRLGTAPGVKHQFIDTFQKFCELLSRDGLGVVLRPHPGGQYALKNGVQLPANAVINNAPIYRMDMRQFSYGISAPSSVLIDMLLADIPTAVWVDSNGQVDTSNYSGLTQVSDVHEWREFARQAAADPRPFLARQRRFLDEQEMPLEPADVFARYARLFQAAGRLSVPRPVATPRHRLLIVANSHLPTVQVCIERPLKSLTETGEMSVTLLDEKGLNAECDRLGSGEAVREWMLARLDQFAADTLMFSRYSGPFSETMVEWARRRGVPIVYHIDDDLLAVPPSLGAAKFAYHNAPERIAAVRALLQEADLVYASTTLLRQRLLDYFSDLNVVSGAVNASGQVMRLPSPEPARIVGYMASADHLPNLMMVLPAITAVLDRHPDLNFELFGSIPVPPELERYGARVRKVDPVANYEEFLGKLRDRNWDIGICPLVPTPFNLAKSNNKWVEYTALGIAVVASGGMIYDQCCADGCGVLATGLDEWESALESLIADDAMRVTMVERAQRKLESEYSVARHREQILNIIQLAADKARSRNGKQI